MIRYALRASRKKLKNHITEAHSDNDEKQATSLNVFIAWYPFLLMYKNKLDDKVLIVKIYTIRFYILENIIS